jgi:hypothetical protein
MIMVKAGRRIRLVKCINCKFHYKEIIMSKKGYAVVLVLAGMICGILLVSLASSPVAAKLPTEGRETTQPVPVIARPGAVKPVPPRATTTPTRPTRPTIARPSIRVYPVGTGGKDDDNSYAYIVKDGKLWYCENTLVREVKFR